MSKPKLRPEDFQLMQTRRRTRIVESCMNSRDLRVSIAFCEIWAGGDCTLHRWRMSMIAGHAERLTTRIRPDIPRAVSIKPDTDCCNRDTSSHSAFLQVDILCG
jgi:hypothetical protein